MSQDTHLFSVRRPRETLGGLNYNAQLGNNLSAIPQPASALKRASSSAQLMPPGGGPAPASAHARSQSGSRLSLAPGRPPQPAFQRSSSSGGAGGPRSSSAHGGMGRMSFAPLQTPARPGPGQVASGNQTVQRRSSVYSRPSTSGPMMAQASFFMQAPIPAGQVADRRRLRDARVQQQLAQELEEYLTAHNFQMDMKHALRPDTLRNPTQKDFTMIFQWLYRRIDPAYVFQRSMDAEVPPILKQLRYPFEKSITKSALMAVGGQNWSTFLGMLHWLMQLATMMDRYANEQYDYACAEEGVDVSSDRIMFRFLRDAYQTWLSSPPGDDEEDDVDKILAPHIEAMAAEFTQGNEQYAEQLKVLEAEQKALEQQIAAAEAEAPDLAKQEAYVATLESDLKKFEAWQTNVGDKLQRHETRNEALRKELEDWEKQLGEATSERAALQSAVDAQGLAVADIDRMNGERERLQSGVDAARSRVDEGATRIREKEVEASERLAVLEGLVRDFNALCYDVGIRESEFELVLQVHDGGFSASQLGTSQHGMSVGSGDRLLAEADTGYHPSKILNLDLRGAVKTHVHGVRRTISKRRNEAKDKDEENRRMLFEVSNAIDDKRLEVEALEHRVRSAEEEFEKTKDNATTQKLNSDAQIERAEKELAKMRAGLSESVQLMEQRELNTQFQYEQLTVRANALREELHTEIDRILHDVCKFKMHVQDALEGYETLVVDELDQELGTVEEAIGVGEKDGVAVDALKDEEVAA